MILIVLDFGASFVPENIFHNIFVHCRELFQHFTRILRPSSDAELFISRTQFALSSAQFAWSSAHEKFGV